MVFLNMESLRRLAIHHPNSDILENVRAHAGCSLRHWRCRRLSSASGSASSNSVAVKSERVAAPATTRFAGGTTVSGLMIGDEIDRIAPTDETLAGSAKMRTAQRRIAAAQSAV